MSRASVAAQIAEIERAIVRARLSPWADEDEIAELEAELERLEGGGDR